VIVDDRSSLQKQFRRARIVLATANGLGPEAIMRISGVGRTTVWRWQTRFMEESVPDRLHRGFANHPPATFRTSASGHGWNALLDRDEGFLRGYQEASDSTHEHCLKVSFGPHNIVPPGICGRPRDDQGRQTPIALPYFGQEIDLKLGWRFQVQSGRVTPINCIL
jgi:hypothetical protein